MLSFPVYFPFRFWILKSTVILSEVQSSLLQLQQKLGKTIIDTQTYICIPNLINFKRNSASILTILVLCVFCGEENKVWSLLFAFCPLISNSMVWDVNVYISDFGVSCFQPNNPIRQTLALSSELLQVFSFSLTILGLFSLLLLLLFLSDKVPKNYFSLLVLYLIVQVSDFSCQEKTLNVWKTNLDTSIIDVTDL